MAEKAKKSTKTKITTSKSTTKKPATNRVASKDKKPASSNKCKFVLFGIAIAAIIAVIIALVCALNIKTIDDSYFVSDDTKYVVNLSSENVSDDGSTVKAVHVVYYRDGDKITGAKSFYEFLTSDAAKAAYDEILANKTTDDANAYSLNGKYVIVTAPKSVYENLTIEDVKKQVEFYESATSGTIPTVTTTETVTETVTE
ncbi:hypothetical protein IKG68_03350 [Candidatus Saccharibacteria bacterium]|nr:hypothetical protein [Candidatus Saccharibacteria bacterium]